MPPQPLNFPSKADERQHAMFNVIAVCNALGPFIQANPDAPYGSPQMSVPVVTDKTVKARAAKTLFHALSRMDEILTTDAFWDGADLAASRKEMRGMMEAASYAEYQKFLPQRTHPPTLTQKQDGRWIAKFDCGNSSVEGEGKSPMAALEAYNRNFLGQT